MLEGFAVGCLTIAIILAVSVMIATLLFPRTDPLPRARVIPTPSPASWLDADSRLLARTIEGFDRDLDRWINERILSQPTPATRYA